MLHHFFTVYSFGETHLHLHADNWSGHNKNRFIMFYLRWSVLTGLHKEITIFFLFIEHTKFVPDWCFGLLRQKYKRTKTGTLENIVAVVKDSASVNYA